MSFGWTIAGTIGQLLLAYFLFMVVVFSASSIAGTNLGKLETGILNLSVFALPALCIVSAAIVVGLHLRGAGATSYWWYAMPLVATALYIAYAVVLAHRT